MNQSHFLSCLDELFELEDGAIQADTLVKQIEGWSSLTFMGLIAVVDEEYEVTLSPGTVLGANTVGDLWAAIERAKSGAAAA
jgi:acyl carrier protein